MDVLENCLACNKPLKNIVVWKTNYDSLFIYVCSTCEKEFKSEFKEISEVIKRIINKNSKINSELDKTVENESLINHKQPTKFNDSVYLREYMFSLLEEVHQLTYHAAFEILLYIENFGNSDETFFSDRYFLTNSVIKTVGAWEKLLIFYSHYFEVEIQPINKLNTFKDMKKKLGKTAFKQTDTFNQLSILMSNGTFKAIDEARKYNDHNISYHLDKNLRGMLNIAKAVVQNVNVLYLSIEEAIELYKIKSRIVERNFTKNYIPNFKLDFNKNNDKIFRKKASKIDSRKIEIDVININRISISYIVSMEARILDMKNWETQYSNPPLQKIYYHLFDIVMRLHEAARSLGYALNMYSDSIKLGYENPENHEIVFPGMNYSYFVKSALIRVYASYDKLGIVFRELFEIEGTGPNASLEKTIAYLYNRKDENLFFINSLPPTRLISSILSKPEYKKIYNNRQDFFHNLVKSNFIPTPYGTVIDFESINALVANGKMIYEVIDSIDIALQSFHAIGLYHQKN